MLRGEVLQWGEHEREVVNMIGAVVPSVTECFDPCGNLHRKIKGIK